MYNFSRPIYYTVVIAYSYLTASAHVAIPCQSNNIIIEPLMHKVQFILVVLPEVKIVYAITNFLC